MIKKGEKMSIYDRFAKVRKYFGLSQAQFAQRINKSPGFISNVEKGRSEVSEKTIIAVCSTFEINKNWLVTGEGDMFAKGQSISKVDKETVGLRLKQIRKQEGLTQQKFADAIGYSKRQVYCVETNKVTPSNDFLRKIATCFNVNYDWLLTGVGDIEIKEAIVDEKLIEWLKKNPDIVKELRIRSGLD